MDRCDYSKIEAFVERNVFLEELMIDTVGMV